MKHFQKKLREMEKYDFIGDIRYKGFIGALDIVRSRKDGIAFDPEERIGNQIYEHSLDNGIVLRPLGDMIYFFLPLIVTEDDIDEIFARTEKVLTEIIPT